MLSEDYKPRLIIEISPEQKQRADRLISQYGLRKAIFSSILDDVLDLIEDHGGVVIGVLLSKKIKPREIIPSMKRAEEVGKR